MQKLLLFFAIIFFSFFLWPKVVHAETCGYPSFCNTSARPTTNTNDPNPGDPCTIPGVTDGYSYQYGSGTCLFDFNNNDKCAVRCGFLGTGFCCDPKDKSHVPPPRPTGLQPPPCKTMQNGQCVTVDTAIGPIQTNVAGLVKNVFSILLGLSGGTAILLIIAAGYQMITSQGNPEKVKEARERLTAAVVGLLFIIFSVAILQIIGVDILNIPGFSR